MRGSIHLDGLEDALRAVVRDEIAAAVAQTAERGGGYFSVEAAAEYLCSTPEAVRSAERRGQLQGTRSGTGRVLFTREQLDAFARGDAA